MAVDNTKDPIFQTFQAIWDCLEADAGFAALVDSRNRIKHTSNSRSPEKPGMQTSDMPQVRVTQTALGGQIANTSSSSTLQIYWAIEIKPGDRRLENLTEIQWAVYQAMSRWHTYLLEQIKWNDAKVFRRLMPLKCETQYGPDDSKPNKPQPTGWIAVWGAIGELYLSTTLLQAE